MFLPALPGQHRLQVTADGLWFLCFAWPRMKKEKAVTVLEIKLLICKTFLIFLLFLSLCSIGMFKSVEKII